MNEEEDVVQKTRLAFEDLCRALNMDEEASNGAWSSYENISKNYTLEVRGRAMSAASALVQVKQIVHTLESFKIN